MLMTVIDYLTTAARWPWLTPLSVISRTIAALISLFIATHRAVCYARRTRQRHRKPSSRPRPTR